MSDSTAGVATKRREYEDALPFVERNRRALAGERKVKASGVEDLPPLPSMCCTIENENGNQTIRRFNGLSPEGKVSYAKYLSLASWFGATGETAKGLVGLINSKQAIKQIEEKVDYLIDNTDGRGTSLREFASDIYTESLITPWSGILVDFPGVEQRVSIKVAEDENLRPKMLFYKFESIINWAYEVVNNQNVLSLLVLMEEIEVRKGFSITMEKQYRHLHLVEGFYNQTIYDNSSQIIKGPTVILVNGKKTNQIPFFWNDSGEDGGSVLDQLIDMNFHHYRISADYGGKLHYSSFSIFYETGAEPNNQNVIIGNGVKWTNTSPDATFGVLEPDGNTDGLRLSQKDDQERMAALGAEALRPRSAGVESAEAKSLDKVAQSSMTADIAITTGDIITKAINFCSRWLGGKEDNFYKPNTDFVPTGMDANTLNALVASLQSGAISYDTFYENLQRGEIASTDRTAEEELALISNQNSDM